MRLRTTRPDRSITKQHVCYSKSAEKEEERELMGIA
jgi:hypothetical protein